MKFVILLPHKVEIVNLGDIKMKKFALILLIFGVLSSCTETFAEWIKLKDEPSGVSYIDNSSYKCSCTPNVIYFKIKQIPTHSKAEYNIYNIKFDVVRYIVYTYLTKYYRSGYAVDDTMPPMLIDNISGDSALFMGLLKAAKYCGDNYSCR